MRYLCTTKTTPDNATQYPEVARSVQENFYMDDYLESSETIKKTREKAQNLVRLLRLVGFNLTKIVSNVREAVADLNRHRENKYVKINEGDKETSHVLGIKRSH